VEWSGVQAGEEEEEEEGAEAKRGGSMPSEGFGVCERWESLAWQLGVGGRREQKIKVGRRGKPFGGSGEIAGRPKAKGKAARWDVGVPAGVGDELRGQWLLLPRGF